MKKFISKIFNKNDNEKKFKELILPKINAYQKIVETKKSLSFLHYGHLGDIIDSLSTVREIAKKKECNLYIQKNKAIPNHLSSKEHPFGAIYLSEESINKILPLLKNQNYLNKVELYDNQNIDIDLNFFRELPYNFNMDSVRWYFHLVGIFANPAENWIQTNDESKFRNYIVILRSLRRQNKYINYSFLEKYENIVFIGLKNEFDDLKKQINNLEFYDCKDFLELATIIRNAKMFIGNLSFGYSLAEGIKVPRLLESFPNFPLVYPSGELAYDFYYQSHFEMLVKKLYSREF